MRRSIILALTACMACSDGPRPRVVEAPTSSASAAVPVAVAPKVVPQAFYGEVIIPGWPSYTDGAALSPSAARLAIWGPALVVIDVDSAQVRGVFSRCATQAAFTPDERALVVIGCPDEPTPQRIEGGITPDTKVYRWDLQTDEQREITAGAYRSITFSADGLSLFLTGEGVARVFDMKDFALRQNFDVGPVENAWVGVPEIATTGLRAWSPSGWIAVAHGARVKVEGVLSPDLTIAVGVAEGRAVAKRADDGKVVFTADIPGNPIALSSTGRVAIATKSDAGEPTVTLLDATGAATCSVPSPGSEYSRDFEWSSDARSFHVGSSVSVPGPAGVSIFHRWYDASTCKEVFAYDAGPFVHGWQAVTATLARARVSGEDVEVIDPVRRIAKKIPLRGVPAIESVEEAAVTLEDGRVFSPTTGDLHEADRAIRVGGARLCAEVAGAVVPIVDHPPVGATGLLFLVDAAGKRTPLEKSEAFLTYTERDPWPSCRAEPRRRFVACARATPDAGRFTAIWDARGKLVDEHLGEAVEISADGLRALFDSRWDGERLLVELATHKATKTTTMPETNAIFSPDGSLVAWEGVGIVDAVTTDVRWPSELVYFDRWVPGTAVVVTRTDSKEYDRGRMTPFGALALLDARTNQVVGRTARDGEVREISEDGGELLYRDAVSIFHLVSTKDARELDVVPDLDEVVLSKDEKFFWGRGGSALVMIRRADRATLSLVPPSKPGDPVVAYTAAGLFDVSSGRASDAARALLVRKGSVLDGTMTPIEDGDPHFRSGLIKRFFAGDPIGE